MIPLPETKPDAPGNKILLIVGPTAIGKSEVAARLAKKISGEVVSADSMQVYKGMDIGTAKPEPGLLEMAPHHMIDIVDPSVDFSVAEFQKLVRPVLAEIYLKGRTPIVVGGSGLYVRAVIDPLDFPAGKPSSKRRRELELLAEQDPEALLDKLKSVDPDAAEAMDARNIRRVIRAIEAAEYGGEKYQERSRRWRERRPIYEVFMVGMTMDRTALNELIDKRVDQMIAAGLEDETKRLVKAANELSRTARQALGYKEFAEYFTGSLSFEETVILIKRRTRRLAKRQLTWFRADPRIVWIEIDGQSPTEVAGKIYELVRARGFIVS